MYGFVRADWLDEIHYYARARIGVEIIYSLSVFVGYGVNRLKLRCKRVSLIW